MGWRLHLLPHSAVNTTWPLAREDHGSEQAHICAVTGSHPMLSSFRLAAGHSCNLKYGPTRLKSDRHVFDWDHCLYPYRTWPDTHAQRITKSKTQQDQNLTISDPHSAAPPGPQAGPPLLGPVAIVAMRPQSRTIVVTYCDNLRQSDTICDCTTVPYWSCTFTLLHTSSRSFCICGPGVLTNFISLAFAWARAFVSNLSCCQAQLDWNLMAPRFCNGTLAVLRLVPDEILREPKSSNVDKSRHWTLTDALSSSAFSSFSVAPACECRCKQTWMQFAVLSLYSSWPTITLTV